MGERQSGGDKEGPGIRGMADAAVEAVGYQLMFGVNGEVKCKELLQSSEAGQSDVRSENDRRPSETEQRRNMNVWLGSQTYGRSRQTQGSYGEEVI